MNEDTRAEGLRLLHFIAAHTEEQSTDDLEHDLKGVSQQHGFSLLGEKVLRKIVPHLAFDKPIEPSLNWWF